MQTNTIASEALAECRRILGAPKTDTFYDLRMTSAERAVLLRAAKLPDTAHYKERKFSAWTDTDREKIQRAAANASNWAKGLQIGH